MTSRSFLTLLLTLHVVTKLLLPLMPDILNDYPRVCRSVQWFLKIWPIMLWSNAYVIFFSILISSHARYYSHLACKWILCASLSNTNVSFIFFYFFNEIFLCCVKISRSVSSFYPKNKWTKYIQTHHTFRKKIPLQYIR